MSSGVLSPARALKSGSRPGCAVCMNCVMRATSSGFLYVLSRSPANARHCAAWLNESCRVRSPSFAARSFVAFTPGTSASTLLRGVSVVVVLVSAIPAGCVLAPSPPCALNAVEAGEPVTLAVKSVVAFASNAGRPPRAFAIMPGCAPAGLAVTPRLPLVNAPPTVPGLKLVSVVVNGCVASALIFKLTLLGSSARLGMSAVICAARSRNCAPRARFAAFGVPSSFTLLSSALASSARRFAVSDAVW